MCTYTHTTYIESEFNDMYRVVANMLTVLAELHSY